jgi:hypothetical protein
MTVRPEDEIFMRSKFLKSEKRLGGGEEASASGSSDEEMDIIANFIENVEVTDAPEAPDQGSTDEYSLSEDPVTSPEDTFGTKSGAWSTTIGSKSSSRQRKSAGGPSSDESSFVMNETDGTSPLPIAKRSSRKSKRPKRIIQDMIDMSLGKKKVQSSEKMLRTAFVEFYRGLGLLKSYRYLLHLLHSCYDVCSGFGCLESF